VPTGQNAARLAFVHFFNVGVSMKHPVIFGCLTAAFAVSTVHGAQYSSNVPTKFPVKHLVVIFQENVSFDHYFGTYPVAKNTDGTTFTAAAGTPTSINTLANPLNPSNSFLPLPPPISSPATRTTMLRLHWDPPTSWALRTATAPLFRSGFRTRKR
jgi:phospholipase C